MNRTMDAYLRRLPERLPQLKSIVRNIFPLGRPRVDSGDCGAEAAVSVWADISLIFDRNGTAEANSTRVRLGISKCVADGIGDFLNAMAATSYDRAALSDTVAAVTALAKEILNRDVLAEPDTGPMNWASLPAIVLLVGLLVEDGSSNKVAEASPLGVMDPMDIAQAALFLASDESQKITGHILPIDGGVLVS